MCLCLYLIILLSIFIEAFIIGASIYWSIINAIVAQIGKRLGWGFKVVVESILGCFVVEICGEFHVFQLLKECCRRHSIVQTYLEFVAVIGGTLIIFALKGWFGAGNINVVKVVSRSFGWRFSRLKGSPFIKVVFAVFLVIKFVGKCIVRWWVVCLLWRSIGALSVVCVCVILICEVLNFIGSRSFKCWGLELINEYQFRIHFFEFTVLNQSWICYNLLWNLMNGKILLCLSWNLCRLPWVYKNYWSFLGWSALLTAHLLDRLLILRGEGIWWDYNRCALYVRLFSSLTIDLHGCKLR